MHTASGFGLRACDAFCMVFCTRCDEMCAYHGVLIDLRHMFSHRLWIAFFLFVRSLAQAWMASVSPICLTNRTNHQQHTLHSFVPVLSRLCPRHSLPIRRYIENEQLKREQIPSRQSMRHKRRLECVRFSLFSVRTFRGETTHAIYEHILMRFLFRFCARENTSST